VDSLVVVDVCEAQTREVTKEEDQRNGTRIKSDRTKGREEKKRTQRILDDLLLEVRTLRLA